MNKRTVIANLNKVANELDNSGMFNEANEITNVMKKLAQLTVPPVVQQPVAAQQVAPPFGSPVVPAVPMAGAVPALSAPMQPVAAPATATTKPPYATSAGAQGTPAVQANSAEDQENQLYTQSIQNINKYFSAKDPASRDLGERLYQNTVNQFKNMQRRGKFMNQVQGLRSKFFPGQSLKPGSY